MNILKTILIIAALSITSACSTIEVAKLEKLDVNTQGNQLGKVTEIKEVSLNAEFSKRLNGAVIGHFIGVGLGFNSSLKFVSAIVGVATVNKYNGRKYHYIKVNTASNDVYSALVPLNYFRLDESVVFIADGELIKSISKRHEGQQPKT